MELAPSFFCAMADSNTTDEQKAHWRLALYQDFLGLALVAIHDRGIQVALPTLNQKIRADFSFYAVDIVGL